MIRRTSAPNGSVALPRSLGDVLLDTALTMAREIAANLTLSVRMAKEAINRVYESSLSDGLLFKRRLFYSSLATQDKAEGTKAFLERRRPFFEDK
jgi:enoyl-CoA hydratase/carnithine racemase